jgi:yecA family protein
LSLPDYQEIEQCLCGDPAAAAESHGTLCGLLCTASDDLPESWIHNTLAEGVDEGAEFDPTAIATLGDLYEETRTSLAGDAMAFRPFLPGEDVDIGLRAEAVGRWCQGFLYGMAVRGLKEMTDLPDEVREILEDFSEISRAIHESGDEDEQAEFALFELVEYVRVGVQLIFDLLNPPTKTAITETR